MSFRDYLRVVGRWKWPIIAFVILTTAAVYGISSTRAPQYTATAQLEYDTGVDISNPLGDSSNTSPQDVALELQSVVSAMTSPEIVDQVARSLGMSPQSKQLAVATDVVPGSTVVQASATSPSPERAARVANAFAAAFIASRKLREQGQLRLAEAVVTTKLRASSKTSPDYAILGQQLRDLQIAEATVTGDYYVLAAATPPESPSSPRPRRDAAAALALSLFTGIVLAFMFEQFNTRLRSHREVAEALRLPVVGRIPRISRRSLRSGALVAIHEPDSPAAESFRVLRNNMDYLSVDDDVSTILVTSCTSGDGKSVTVSNLALTLAMGGLKVVAVDADLRRPRLHEYFDLPNTQGLSTLVAGKAELANVLQPVVLPLPAPRTGSGDSGTDEPDEKARRSKLYVLTSGPLPPNPGEILASRRFGAILHELGNSTVDIVLVDSPDCMSVGDAAAIAAKVDGTFMLVSMSSITRPVLADAGEFLERLPCRKLGIIAVRDTTLRTSQYGYHSEKKRAVLV